MVYINYCSISIYVLGKEDEPVHIYLIYPFLLPMEDQLYWYKTKSSLLNDYLCHTEGDKM